MKVELPYGRGTIALEVPDKNLAAVLRLKETKRGGLDDASVVRASLDPSYQDFLSLPGELLVIVNDATRATPTRFVLDAIGEDLRRVGASFIIATGTHRAPTESELQFIFGSWLETFRDSIHVHDCHRMEDMEYLGTTSFGTELYLNNLVAKAQKILVIGSVEPHYFAGYAGGRKAFLPGTAAYCSIEHNHRMALSPKARAFALEGNPVHDDMMEASTCVKAPIYSIMTILDRDLHIESTCSGSFEKSFNDAVVEANRVYTVPLDKEADIVVVAAPYPLDIDLFQSEKALDNGVLAMKEGGTVILVSECRDGLGGKAFVDLMTSESTPDGVLARIESEFKVGYQRAAKLAQLVKVSTVQLYSGLGDSQVRSLFLEPVHDLQKALDEAIGKHGPSCRVIVMPQGSVTVPMVVKTLKVC